TETPSPRGHSIEFRLNAEDPGRDFLPTPGEITVFEPPSGPGVRLDTGVVAGSSIAPAFDSLMGKLIITGSTREQALARARRALAEFRIEGVASVLPFARAVLEEPDFVGENFRVHTRWIETDFTSAFEPAPPSTPGPAEPLFRTHIEIAGRRTEVGFSASLLGRFAAPSFDPASPKTETGADEAPGIVRAPLPGTLEVWRVADGDRVEEGDVIAVMEAMKMETSIRAPCRGTITRIAAVGSTHPAGAVIARISA
ncbi:MAG: biotin/lipoyl-binding protein, partial [Acetobacteraceae bacterium]|nr:biotin/lipoyl-binding protein [Acetobacteraceae bacterium]